MIRDLATFLYGVALALGIGIGSAVWATDRLTLLDELNIHGWVAHPGIGRDTPDPYSQAYFSRSGALPLAAAEGLTFARGIDDWGSQLNARCTYLVKGDTPGARLWTLRVLRGGLPFTAQQDLGIPVELHSRGILRSRNGDFEVRISPIPQPGNWIYAGTQGAFTLSLSLYDTTIASDTGISELPMPSVTNLGCVNG